MGDVSGEVKKFDSSKLLVILGAIGAAVVVGYLAYNLLVQEHDEDPQTEELEDLLEEAERLVKKLKKGIKRRT